MWSLAFRLEILLIIFFNMISRMLKTPCMKTLNGIPYFLAPLVMLVGYVLNSHSLIFKVLLKILKAQLTFLKFHRNV